MNLFKKLDWETGIGILENDVSYPKMDGPFIERRRAPRIALNVPVSFRAKGRIKNWQAGESLDISKYGVRLSSASDKIQPGTRVDLTIKLPESPKPFKLEGVVIWVKPSAQAGSRVECGVSFENPTRISRLGKILAFFADKLCVFAIEQSKQLEARPVSSIEELKSSYHLVYNQYLQRGYCQENESKMYYTYFCILPKAQAFILKNQEKMIGTASLIPDSSCGLPMEYTFPDEISALRRPGRLLAEVSLLALDLKAFEKKSFTLTDFEKLSAAFKLFKALFDYGRNVLKVTDFVITMHPKHQGLYQYLKFKTIGGVKPYSTGCRQPALPMYLDIEEAIRTTPRDGGLGAYFLRNETSSETGSGRSLNNKELVREFLINLQKMWPQIPDKHKHTLQSHYPEILKPPKPS